MEIEGERAGHSSRMMASNVQIYMIATILSHKFKLSLRGIARGALVWLHGEVDTYLHGSKIFPFLCAIPPLHLYGVNLEARVTNGSRCVQGKDSKLLLNNTLAT